jgi:hypothetical protein
MISNNKAQFSSIGAVVRNKYRKTKYKATALSVS